MNDNNQINDSLTWYCEYLHLRAKQPQCLQLIKRPSMKKLIDEGHYEVLPYRPPKCEQCETFKKLKRKNKK